MSSNTAVIGYIRTYVPYAIGLVLAWLLAHTGIDLNGPFQVAIAAFGVAVVTNLYYLIVRVAETKVPGIGVLLGVAKQPVYEDVSDLWNSFVRTAIPTLVSAIVVTIVGSAIHLNADMQSGLIAVGVGIVSSLYYTLARYVESKLPKVKLLLRAAPVTFKTA